MNQSVSFGKRLREERLRLAKNQTDFAAKGGVTKKTQMLYEAGSRSPDADYLAAIEVAGADVNYILTGIEGSAQALLDAKQARITRAIDAGMGVEEVRALERVSDTASVEAITAMLRDCRATERAAVFTLLSSIVGLRKAARGGSK